MSLQSRQLIVADIGATNGRFAVAESLVSGTRLYDVKTYRNADFDSVGSLLAQYLADTTENKPREAVLAIAGPNDGSRGYMVNIDWRFDAAALEAECDLDKVVLVNDFAAMAMGVPALDDGDLRCLNPGNPGTGTISVCGPGTGLGVALLIPSGDRYLPVSTEGGHVAFSPATEQEHALQRFLAGGTSYLPVEDILAGKGLPGIYRFLQQERGQTAPDRTPAEIGEAALAGDPLCRDVVLMFLAILGGALGDFALAHGATGGMYIAGGVAPRFAELIPESALLERFRSKGPLSDYMADVPLHLVTAEHAALRGAAACYRA